MNPDIRDFLTDLQLESPKHYDIILACRDLFFQLNSDLTEKIMYGGIIFFKEKMMLSGLFSYANHVSIEFGQGYQFDDPHSVLEGKGKYRRHIKLSSLDDIESKHVHIYIEQAIGNT